MFVNAKITGLQCPMPASLGFLEYQNVVFTSVGILTRLQLGSIDIPLVKRLPLSRCFCSACPCFHKAIQAAFLELPRTKVAVL
jgi:hypothetical protein